MQREIRVQCKDYTQDVAMPLVAGDYNAYVIVMPVSSADNVTGFMVVAQKPDGVVITDTGTVRDNVCRYTIKTNMYDVPGEVVIRVAPMSSDAKLTVCELRCTAVAAFDGSSEVPADRVPALSAAVAYAQEMGDYAAAQGAKIENEFPELLDDKANVNTPSFWGDATFNGGVATTFSPKCKVSLDDNNVSIAFSSSLSPLPDKIIFGDGTLKFETAGQTYILIFNQDGTVRWVSGS